MNAKDGIDIGECPYLNEDDARCRAQFSLHAIDRTFDLCLGRYHACSVYYQLKEEDAIIARGGLLVEVSGASPDAAETVPLTLHGDRVDRIGGDHAA